MKVPKCLDDKNPEGHVQPNHIFTLTQGQRPADRTNVVHLCMIWPEEPSPSGYSSRLRYSGFQSRHSP